MTCSHYVSMIRQSWVWWHVGQCPSKRKKPSSRFASWKPLEKSFFEKKKTPASFQRHFLNVLQSLRLWWKKHLMISLQIGLCDLGKLRVTTLKCYTSSHFSENKNESKWYGLSKTMEELSVFVFRLDNDLGSGATPGHEHS